MLFHLNEKISIGLKSNQEVGASKLIMYMRKIPLKSYPFQFLNPELYPTKPLKGIKLVILTCKGIDVLMFQNVIKKFCIAEDCFFFSSLHFFFICITILIVAIFPIPGAFCRSVDVRFKLLFSLMKLSIKKLKKALYVCVYWSKNRKIRKKHISVSCQTNIKTN